MPYDKSNKQIQDSAFKMKAYKTGPMQKNFGKDLAINKSIDKDSGTGKTGQPSPLAKKLKVTSKLGKASMEGGLTGKPSAKAGKLGPMQKKKGGTKPSSIGAKMKAKYKGTKQTTDRFGKKIGGKGTQAERSARVNAPKKKSTYKAPKAENEIKVKTKNNLTLGKSSNSKIVMPKSKPYVKPKSNIPTKAQNSAKKSVGVLKATKPNHNKGLKGKTGVERRKYYDKHKLKYDKTISFGPNFKKK